MKSCSICEWREKYLREVQVTFPDESVKAWSLCGSCYREMILLPEKRMSITSSRVGLKLGQKSVHALAEFQRKVEEHKSRATF